MAESFNQEQPGPPPLPISSLQPEPRGPWGFWQTVGWSAIIGAAYLAVQIFTMIAFVVGHVAVNKTAPSTSGMESNGSMLAIALILCAPVVAGLAMWFVKLRKGATIRDYLGLRWPTAKQAFVWVFGSISLVIAIDCLTVALGRPLVPEVMAEIYRNTSCLPLLWLGMFVAAPVSEEILFRGFIFRGFAASRIGALGAILLTAGPWAFIHFQYDLYGIACIFVFGIVLGFARLKTGSLLLCMVLHGLMNVVATIEIAFLPTH